ncbi:MAG TPA: alanyl-tRNA editing protein [Candidatus Acidoferrum sp.]|nr:alanyl-tRNA editing protein [Candidatus Acidoferrum sp.]
MVDLAKFVQEIPPTICIYLEDSYAQSVDSNVLRVAQEKSSAYVALDRTIFHPRSGGQPSDVGTIEGSSSRVNVRRAMNQSGIIVHFGKVEGKFETGAVTCKIDWANRFLMMRRHTAAHLLDYCLATLTDSRVETTDSWLGDDAYVGYGGTPPSDLDLKQLQELGNSFIRQNLNVEIRTMERNDAERLIADAPNLARLPKTEKLRIVTIQGQLPIPCGGTHVRALKEIGVVEVRRTEPAEAGFRLHFEVK